MAKIIGQISGQSEDKRFKIPGFKVEDECSDCKKIIHWNGGAIYRLSELCRSEVYSVDFHFYCADCDKEWDIKVSRNND